MKKMYKRYMQNRNLSDVKPNKIKLFEYPANIQLCIYDDHNMHWSREFTLKIHFKVWSIYAWKRRQKSKITFFVKISRYDDPASLLPNVVGDLLWINPILCISYIFSEIKNLNRRIFKGWPDKAQKYPLYWVRNIT